MRLSKTVPLFLLGTAVALKSIDECAKSSTGNGITVLQCPGCQLNLQSGRISVQQGECADYGLADLGYADSHVIQIPGCQRVVRNGRLETEHGGGCGALPKLKSKCRNSGKSRKKNKNKSSDPCTKVVGDDGGSIIACPGCVRIVDKDDKTNTIAGPNCDKYGAGIGVDAAEPVDGSAGKGTKDDDGCTRIQAPDGTTVIQCQGCLRIINRNGEEVFRLGSCQGRAERREGLLVQRTGRGEERLWWA